MAEHVQASLDRMVAPLRDLMDRQIFTEEEIRAVVSRRRESEYLLRRRAARKADFVRYIEAETLLEKLRVLRTARRKRDHRKARRETGLAGDGDADDNDDNNNNNNDDDHEECIGDAHIVQHVHLLFVRAIRKFRGDVSLHLQHAEFCKTVGSRTRLSRVYAEALQVFPREAGIWIEAASNEFFGPNRSVKSARVLLQRALRLNGSSSEELWVQYFSLELHYAQTLRGRRTILDPSGSNGGGGGSSDDDDDENTTTATTTDYNKIPMVVLRNAIRSIPNSVRFRLTFLDVCREFPDTAGLVEYVQNSMATDFANEPESWIARAVYQAEKRREEQPNDRNSNHDHDTDTDHEPAAKRARNSKEQHGKHKRGAGVDPVVAVLRRATKTLDTSEMLLQAFRFARDYGKELEREREPEQEQDGATNNQRAMKQVDAFIRTLWSKANQKRTDDFISPELAMEQTRYLLEKGKEKEAVKTIQTCCTGTKPPKNKHARVSASSSSSIPVEAWLLWASLLSSSIQKQKSILERALESISMDTHPDYVVALLQYLGVGLKMRAMIHDGEEKTNDQNGGGSDCRDGDEDDDDDNDDKATEVLLFGTLQKLLLLSPKTVEDVCIRNGSTGLEFEIGDVFSAYLLCLEAFYERGGIGGARKIYEAVLFRSTATARGALSANHADRIQEFVDRCLALELEAIEAAGLDGTNHKKRARSGVLRKLYDKAIDIFSGSPLEGPYREDRNENTIFA